MNYSKSIAFAVTAGLSFLAASMSFAHADAGQETQQAPQVQQQGQEPNVLIIKVPNTKLVVPAQIELCLAQIRLPVDEQLNVDGEALAELADQTDCVDSSSYLQLLPADVLDRFAAGMELNDPAEDGIEFGSWYSFYPYTAGPFGGYGLWGMGRDFRWDFNGLYFDARFGLSRFGVRRPFHPSFFSHPVGPFHHYYFWR